jgi:hypothetical protein
MTGTLQEILLAPETQPKVIADCHALIEQEVAGKSGVSGTAVKLAYKTVTSFGPGYGRRKPSPTPGRESIVSSNRSQRPCSQNAT